MTNTNLDDMTLAELHSRKNDLGDDDYGIGTDHIDAELEERAEKRSKTAELVDMKIQLKLAEDAGLEDDPAVADLREHVAELDAHLYADPRSELAEKAGVDEARLADLSDDEIEKAQTHVEAINMFATSEGDWAEDTVNDHRADLEALLDEHDVAMAELSAVPEYQHQDTVVNFSEDDE
ncbi:hypothetical protein [Halarchaeum nitratireducens]|uniref:Uncharacterized protein n=1 Tax=Halarchaeum nitratireducens TaxID=489913 RepID=A0A830GF60_9EURY|nr:hypothetical protein [Halarchaeum nitratireducens]GGN26922.1 hypothetical protein GCM10009021_31770 [Halarchaeum nitratireducens]